MGDGGRDRVAPLAIGTVLGRAFGVMSGNPVTVFGLAFLFGALPSAAFGLLTRIDTAGDVTAQAGLIALYFGSVLVFIVCSALSQAALVRATSAYLDGRREDLGECARVGITKALPVIGLSILFGIGMLLGLFVFIIPALMLLVRWAVAIPVLIEEEFGVAGAFGRSSELTKGARWQVFFLLIVVMVVMWLISIIAALPGLMLGVNPLEGQSSAVGIGLSLVSSTFTTALWATVLTSLYFSLRERREGPGTRQLEDVFA